MTTKRGPIYEGQVYGRNEKHAMRPVEGQETSMHMEEPHRATDDDGRITPSRGENKEDGNDESWHDAREDWWE